ncbi:MAG TPA: hypothetical protein ENK93_05220 [Campylobacteraceae bacterium]|nr:hypothetical protein [Campylobacteraceae bacterium]
MKLLHIAAGTLLLMGLSSTAYAKCGGGGMMMQGDFKTVQSNMLKNLDEMENCVKSATSKQDLKKCRMQMMQKRKQMMQNKAKPGAMQCGAGKCGGGK